MKRSNKIARKASVTPQPAEFLLDSNELLDKVQRIVEQHCRIVVEPGSNYTLHYLDTFDWRLYRTGRTLSAVRNKSNRKLVLATRAGEILQSIAGAAPPAFARNLPPGRFRHAIAGTIEPRRLLARARLKIHETIVRILNTDEKTVVRLALQTRALSKSGKEGDTTTLAAVVRVVPVKGYIREHQTLVALLKNKLGLSSTPECAFASAMKSAGLTPGGYIPKLTIALRSRMRGGDAVRAIHRSLLNTILVNADGVRRNLDPEFLHEYRVAIRATRSALRQIKDVFPDSEVQHFSNEFKWLGAATGPVRDLDVYLLKMDEFRAELPNDMREHLWPLEKYLHVHHDKEHRQLLSTLGSKRYRALMDDWSVFLGNSAPVTAGACQGAALPVIDLASDRIWRTYRRVRKRARTIEQDTPAEALHALRVECKKLRYLLEFFNSLYPPEEVGLLIQTLKQLQTNLGNFNDCEVQRLALRRIANEMHQHGLASADTFLAMGRLMEHLSDEQLDQRRRFQARFDSFAMPENRKRYRRLFKPSAKEVH
ncbi:MAG: CHAD domain-containing protein [Betaproteobacteria bacterium]|nr:MAG: CHAD domain-containing protein [Betaproteobacteria bacterium]